MPIVKRERRGATMPMGEMKRREREKGPRRLWVRGRRRGTAVCGVRKEGDGEGLSEREGQMRLWR